jgi:uncharacterized membrane protein YfcA
MSDARRFTLFTVLCFPLALVSQIAAVWLLSFYPAAAEAGMVSVFYGVPVALCGVLGARLGAWNRRQTIAANVLASLICFIAPFAGLIAALYLLCVFGTDCP